jgi:neopullulanase
MLRNCFGIILLVAIVASHSMSDEASLSVKKMDPPDWWQGSSTPTIRMLVEGTSLFANKVGISLSHPGLTVANFKSSENGHYLFFDLTISSTVPPGSYPIRLIEANKANVEIPFAITAKDFTNQRIGRFTNADCIYFVMPDRFVDGNLENNHTAKSPDIVDRSKARHYHGGDLAGLESKLSYIQELGATAIWLTPVYDNNDGLDYFEAYPDADGKKQPSTGYHGYGAIDMYGVDEHLGTSEDLKRFIASAHQKGIKVIQDQVANHTGPYHTWAKDPPTPTWWNGTAEKHLDNNWQKWTAMSDRASPHIKEKNLNGWFIDVLPDFNQDDPEVTRYLIQNSLWWIERYGFDAIRMDTLPHVPRSFWKEWSTSLKREFPNLNILGELFDSDPVLLSYYQTGRVGHDGIDTGIDTLFDFGLFNPIRNAFARGRSIREVTQMFSRDWIYPNADVLTTFVGVHDMNRFMQEEGATIEGLQLAFTLIMTSRGTPLIYYGDELAMKGGGDPDNRRDFPGGFPGDQRDAFTQAGRTESENKVWNRIARLNQLRKEYPELSSGKTVDLYEDDQQLAYIRIGKDRTILVVFNNANQETKVQIPIAPIPEKQRTKAPSNELLGGGTALQIEKNADGHAMVEVVLPARSAGAWAFQ